MSKWCKQSKSAVNKILKKIHWGQVRLSLLGYGGRGGWAREVEYPEDAVGVMEIAASAVGLIVQLAQIQAFRQHPHRHNRKCKHPIARLNVPAKRLVPG